jgi:hypothetical protein
MSQILPVEVVSAVWSEIFGESDTAVIPPLDTTIPHPQRCHLTAEIATASWGARPLVSSYATKS